MPSCLNAKLGTTEAARPPLWRNYWCLSVRICLSAFSRRTHPPRSRTFQILSSSTLSVASVTTSQSYAGLQRQLAPRTDLPVALFFGRPPTCPTRPTCVPHLFLRHEWHACARRRLNRELLKCFIAVMSTLKEGRRCH